MTTIILFIVLIISLITDIKSRIILNIITLPAIIIGLLSHTIHNGWSGFIFSILGMLTGFGVLLIPYLLKGMAAGDVKLMMAIGALKGSTFTFGSFLHIAIFGGIIALFILIRKRELRSSLKRIFLAANLRSLDNLNQNEYHHAFPYGVAIVLGTFSYYGVNLL